MQKNEKKRDLLLSVIIPVYNLEDYIGEALNSILSQKFTLWEAIIVDDGSLDHSLNICKSYALRDSRFRVYHQENKGVSSARNLGLKLAKGKYITFLDGDDFLLSDAFDIIMYNLTKNKADIGIFGYTTYTESKETFIHMVNNGMNIDIDCVIEHCLRPKNSLQLVVWNKIYHRSLIYNGSETILFPIDLTIGEDAVWLINVLLNARKSIIIPYSGYYYRQNRPNSAVHNSRTTKYVPGNISRFQAAKRILNLLKNKRYSVRRLALRRCVFPLKDLSVHFFVYRKMFFCKKCMGLWLLYLNDYLSMKTILYDAPFLVKSYLLYFLIKFNISRRLVSYLSKM